MEEYYGSGTKAFDKDKIDHFTARYILNANEQTLSNGNAGYIFVDSTGNEINDANRMANVDVTGLTQYLYIDNPNSNIGSSDDGSIATMS